MSNSILPLTKDPNLVFDAVALKAKIMDRLNQGKVFTDHNYEGSNLSSLIDIISYSFGTLLYYLNKTSSESMFSEAQLYENMNKIVKLLNYNPIGKLAQNVLFSVSAKQSLPKGTYIIPRFSYVNVAGVTFSLSTDLSFSKITSLDELVSDVDNTHLLYQGTFEEYPKYVASGLDSEIIYLNPGSNINIDHYNIYVYVKPNNGSWEEWKRTDNRILHKATEKIFEVRYNSNKNYELSFGDNINGQKLNALDQVAIYYLNTDPSAKTLGVGGLDKSALVPFNSIQFIEILNKTQSSFGSYITRDQFKYINLSNNTAASPFSYEEGVDSIRENAPKVFRSQHRLVTSEDYSYFTKTNFANLITDCITHNNEDFLKSHLRYLLSIGLQSPQLDTQVLYNQIKFGTSCNFNNIYLYMVPKQDTLYLSANQKEFILNELNKYKTITSHVITMDPEYLFFDFYVKDPDITPSTKDVSNCKFRIFKTLNAQKSDAAIKFDVLNILLTAFDKKLIKLGQTINTHQITTDILALDGVQGVQTYRSDTGVYVDEISFLVWNSKYPQNDIQTRTQTVQLESFMYPILHDAANLLDRLEVVNESKAIKVAEF